MNDYEERINRLERLTLTIGDAVFAAKETEHLRLVQSLDEKPAEPAAGTNEPPSGRTAKEMEAIASLSGQNSITRGQWDQLDTKSRNEFIHDKGKWEIKAA